MISTNNSINTNLSKAKKELIYDDENLTDIVIDVNTYKNEEFASLNLLKNRDLTPGQYEGGIKVWECSLDLCKFLPGYVGWYDLSGLKVLELGCGHGLPGLYFLLRNAKVLFQDFNTEILDKITKEYIEQVKEKYKRDLLPNAGFLSGDWKDFGTKLEVGDVDCTSNETKEVFISSKFDIIVSADTIYNMTNYDSFYQIIKERLNNPGICFICSKKYYFGVGGGTSQFIDFVKEKGDFEIKIAKEFNDGMSNIRQILEIKNKK